MASGCPTCTHFDSLTGLPNRRSFLERLEDVVADARAQRFDIAVLAVDIDRLRNVNSSLGHRVGDQVLEIVASRLQECVPDVARSAGDEFLVLVPRLDVDAVMREILSAIARPLEIDGYVLNLTATIGISVFPGDGLDGESLVRHAVTALYRAKRGAHPIASPFLESGLRRAVERSEFVLHYQPIVHLASQQISRCRGADPMGASAPRHAPAGMFPRTRRGDWNDHLDSHVGGARSVRADCEVGRARRRDHTSRRESLRSSAA